MAKIKHTKTELKAQKEALERYQRYLPMLQLKKQQLQSEIQSITAQIKRTEGQIQQEWRSLDTWIEMFSEDVELGKLLELQKVETDEGNIAGVSIPVLKNVVMRKADYDLFETPAWTDEAVEFLDKVIRLRVKRDILKEQRDRITRELRTTTQRVNLFEKVKIPECRENIRVIKIFLGEEQTAAVVRGKIAKSRTLEYEYEDAA
ncbi:MAG: V-type ATP synthase subunit D [Kiritimatiellia bacterium]